MSNQIQLSPTLTLPEDVFVQVTSILAKRRVGKSNTGCVFVEQALDADVPCIIIDPKGDWWGIRSSGDGKGAGYPVVVLGGDHADVPLDSSAGKMIGEWLAREPVSVVLDVSEFGQAEMVRFIADFATAFYKAKKRNRTPCVIVLEEVDEYCPQSQEKHIGPDLGRCIGAIARLAKRGGFAGIGLVCITLRSASFNKNVLSQTDVLIVMRTNSPHDIKAVKEWFHDHPDDDKEKQVMATIRSLGTGEGFVYAPELGIFERVQFHRRSTFDSGFTPKLGKKRPEPKILAPVDLERLRGQMTSYVEEAKQNDPAELKRRIRILEAELAKKPSQVAVVEQVPVLTAQDYELLHGAGRRLEEAATRAVGEVQSVLDRVASNLVAETDRLLPVLERLTKRASMESTAARVTMAPPSNGHQAPKPPTVGKQVEGVTPAQQRLLDALGWLQSIGIKQAPKSQVAFLAGASPKSSAFANNLGALRSQYGLIDYPATGLLCLTGGGEAAANIPEAPLDPGELHARIASRLPPAKWRILEALIRSYPSAVAKEEVAGQAGASPTSSAFANNLGNLRTLGLIDYPKQGMVRAAPLLFLEVSA